MIFGYAFHTVIGFVVTYYGGVGKTSSLMYGVSVIPIALGVGIMGFIFFGLSRKEKFLNQEKIFV